MTTNANTAPTAEHGTTIFIPLNKLKKHPKNARKTPHSEASIEAKAASIAFEQPVAVLREGRMVPDRIVHAKPDEPAEQKIELHPFHQMPFRANPIKRLQQHRPKQLLRCDRGAAEVRVELAELVRKIAQRRIGQVPDRP